MRSKIKRVLVFGTVLYVSLGAFLLSAHFLSEKRSASANPAGTPQPVSSPAPGNAEILFPAGKLRVWDAGAETLYTLTEAEYLRGALLCEMSPEAPSEALKAQAVAAATLAARRARQNREQSYDLVCNSAAHTVYMTDKEGEKIFGDAWDAVQKNVNEAAKAVAGELLWYGDEPAETLCTAITAGCTQPYRDVWAGDFPYLEAVACPFDLLYDDCRGSAARTPEEVKTAFPDVTFSGDPENWFSDAETFDTGYVKKITLCGTPCTGQAVRTALDLKSAAFTVQYGDGVFTFTTLGWGHGVGMSQAGAIYLAETGWSYRDILSYFFPKTVLKTG